MCENRQKPYRLFQLSSLCETRSCFFNSTLHNPTECSRNVLEKTMQKFHSSDKLKKSVNSWMMKNKVTLRTSGNVKSRSFHLRKEVKSQIAAIVQKYSLFLRLEWFWILNRLQQKSIIFLILLGTVVDMNQRRQFDCLFSYMQTWQSY